MVQLLTLPGIGNSGRDHWQSRWEALHNGVRRVQLGDWDAPASADWIARLQTDLMGEAGPCVLIAHSLACLLVAQWAEAHGPGPVIAALLVAIPDPTGACFPKEATGFSAALTQPLPFPSLVIASDDDPYGSVAFARACAGAWRSELLVVERGGHLNSASGLGDWPTGWSNLQRLIKQAST